MERKKYEKIAQEVNANIKLAGGTMRFDRTERTVSETIRAIKRPLILVLDEAQMVSVGHTTKSPEIIKAAHLFNHLHNLELEHGLVFLMAGLSDTRSIFEEFKMSRFNSRCVLNLSVLDKKAERNTLKDYLVQGAGVDESHSELDHWIDQMSEETHQWAHHISCYGQVASAIVKNSGGVLSNDLLSEVLKESQALKDIYYDDRFEELNKSERVSIFNAIFENEEKENIIMGSKAQSDFEKNPIIKNPEKIFQEVMSRGILQIRRGRFYQIPIPSLRAWMLQEYQAYLKIIDQKPSLKIQQLMTSIQTPKEVA